MCRIHFAFWIFVLAASSIGFAQVKESPVSDDVPQHIAAALRAADEGFEPYVRIADLPDIINSRKPGALADFALLTAEAEKVLGRRHKSGVSAKQLLQLAYELSQQESDNETATRLGQRVKAAYSDLNLNWDNAAAPSLAMEEMKKATSELPADASPQVRETFEGLLGDVKTALLLQNADRLKELQDIAGKQTALSPAMQNQITSVINSASKFEARDAAESKAMSELMSNLAASAGCIFYVHSWGGGATYTIYGDQFTRSNMPDGWNDVVSSLWVRRGHLVYCWQHVNYGGARCWVLVERNGTPNSSPFRDHRLHGDGRMFEMSSHGWNDVISSFRLELR